MRRLLNKGLFAAAMLSAAVAGAKEYRVPLSRVATAGFYRILLPADYHAHGSTGSLSLADADGTVQSYFRHSAEPYQRIRRRAVPLSVVRSNRDSTVVTLQNSGRELLDGLWLKIRNNDVMRMAELSGSEDGRQYFAVIDSLALQANGASDTVSGRLSFPATAYPYLRLCIRNRGLQPLSVLGAYTDQSVSGMKQWQPVAVAGLRQRDSSDGNSYLQIMFAPGYNAELLRLHFSGPKYYSRQITFSGSYYGAHGLRQGDPLTLGGSFRDTVLAVVGNGANPPLRLDSAQAMRTADYLVAWLDPGDYELRYSDAPAAATIYDLEALRDSLSSLALPMLQTSAERLLSSAAPALRPASSWPKVFMWTAIIAVLTGLVFASRALMRKVNS